MTEELISLCRSFVLRFWEKIRVPENSKITISVSVRQKIRPDHRAVYDENTRLILETQDG